MKQFVTVTDNLTLLHLIRLFHNGTEILIPVISHLPGKYRFTGWGWGATRLPATEFKTV